MPNPSPSATARRVLGLADVEEPDTLRSAGRRALDRVGGPVGLAAATAPTIAFVVTDALAGPAGGLGPAFVAVGATAVLAFTVRLLRREPPGSAIAGLLIAGVCAGAAALVGEARAFFLPTTLLPAVFVLAYSASLIAGRPLTALLVHPFSGGPRDWRGHPGLRRVYVVTSLVGLTLAAVNLVVRIVFYVADEPAVLGAIQVAATPVFAVHFVLTLALARRVAAVPVHTL